MTFFKNKKFFATVVALIVIVAIGYALVTSRVNSDHTIKIVGSYPMQKISVGRDIVNGIKLALAQAGHSAAGYTIDFEVKDDGNADGQWSAAQEKQNATDAAQNSNVMVYLGPFNSGAAQVSIPITNAAGLVQVSPGNTWPGLTQAGFAPGQPGIFYPTGIRTYFRVCPTDALQGPAGAIWAKELGAKSVYIFDDGEAFGKGIGGLFDHKARAIGLLVQGHVTLDKTASNFNALLLKLKSNPPDLIYFAGITPNGSVPFVKEVRQMLPHTIFMGPDGIQEQAFIDQAGAAAAGVYTTTVGIPPNQLTGKGKLFVDAYKAAYGIDPGTYSVFGYEAANVVLRAIERAGEKDRTKILNEIAATINYDGLFGGWSFDSNGDTSLTLVSGSIVKDNRFEFQKLLGTH